MPKRTVVLAFAGLAGLFGWLVLPSLIAIAVFNQADALPKAITSDVLLPADLAHAVWSEDLPWQSFQLPQVPSLFPDLVTYIPLFLLTGSWRWAALLTGCLQMTALSVGAGLLVGQMTGAAVIGGMAGFLALAVPLACGEIAFHAWDAHLRIVLQVVAHGGPFVATLFAAVLALRCLRLPSAGNLIGLYGLATVSFLSDHLTVFEFQLPFLLALLLPTGFARRATAKTVAVVLASLPCGMVPDLLFLNKQSDVTHILHHTAGQSLSLWHDASFGPAALWLLPVVLVFSLPLLTAPQVRLAMAGRPAVVVLWRLGLLASLLSTAAAIAFLYEDQLWTRYLQALFWWPVILAAAWLGMARPSWSDALSRPAVAGGLTLVVLFAAHLDARLPLILSWRDDLADCVLEHRGEFALGNGLATYQNARRMTAAVDWGVEIDQINPDGGIYYWGNDPLRYLPRPGKPAYNFVIADGLDATAIERNFGTASRSFDCPGSTVWVYDDSVPLRATLQRTYPILRNATDILIYRLRRLTGLDKTE